MSKSPKTPKETTTTTKVELPDEAKPYVKPFMDSAWNLSQQPYQQYPGTTVAPLNQQQLQAVSNIQQRATMGSPVVKSSQDMVTRTQGNDYLNYALNLAGQRNPYMGATTPVGQNALLGLNNPYLNDAIGYSQDDLLRGYNKAVLPQFAAMDRASGSFGNSGIQEMKLEAQRQLAQELGRTSSDMRMQDYGLQAQLGEGDVARRAQYANADIARNAGLSEAQLTRLLNAYQAERQNQMQAASLAPNLAEQDYRDMQALLGAGDVLRSYQGEKLAEQNQNWLAQQQWPYSQLDVLANALRTTMGGGGTTTVTQPNPYQPSRTASAIGGGALGYAGAQAMGMSSPWMGGLLGAGAGYALG